MAQLRDIPVVWRRIGIWELLKRVHREMGDDNLLVWASAVAYAWLFAIFPFFLFLIALTPYLKVEWRESAKAQISAAIFQQMPREAATQIWSNVEPQLDQVLNRPPPGIKALFSIGLLLTLWGASGGVNMTMLAIDKCYEVQHARPFYKQRPLAVMLTVVFVTLILLVMVLIPIGTVVTRWATVKLVEVGMERYLPLLILWQVVRYALALFLMLTVLEMAYYFGPNVKQKWHWLSPGAVFTVMVWMLLGLSFRLYVDKYGNYSATYGTVGGVAILLLLFYIDSVVMLLGAEINSEIDKALDQLPPEGAGVPVPRPDSQTFRAETAPIPTGARQGEAPGEP